MTEEFDMFGNPNQPGRGCKGRPPFQATDKDCNKIKMLLALGWCNSRIANALDISAATLKRYFRAELKVRSEMRDRLDARRFELVLDQAQAGNVTAMKELTRMIEKSDQMAIAAIMRGSATKPAKEKKLGKKEQRKRDAVTPDNNWDFLPGMNKAEH